MLNIRIFLIILLLCGLLFFICFVVATGRAIRKRGVDRERLFSAYYREYPPLEDDDFLAHFELEDGDDRQAALEVRARAGQWAGVPRRRIWPATALEPLGQLGIGGEPASLFHDIAQHLTLDTNDASSAAVTTIEDLVYCVIACRRRRRSAPESTGDETAAGAHPDAS